jgi:hypothetical protein
MLFFLVHPLHFVYHCTDQLDDLIGELGYMYYVRVETPGRPVQ